MFDEQPEFNDDFIKITGDTDETPIGNVSDAMKVHVANEVGTSSLANDGTLWSAADVINAADSDEHNPLMLIINPSGSTKDFYFWRSRIAMLVTNNNLEVRIYSNPTVTANGTAITPRNRNIGGTNPSVQTQAYRLPTISANGNLITVAGIGQNNNSIDLNEDFAIRLAPNNSLLITGKPSSNNRAAAVTIVWQERDPV